MTANTERERESEVEQGLHEVAVWLQTSSGQHCQSLQASLGCSPQPTGRSRDAFRCPGWQERRGRAGERARRCSGDSEEVTVALLLQRLGWETLAAPAVSAQVRLRPGNLSYLSDIREDLNITVVTGLRVLKVKLLCWWLGKCITLLI